MDLSRRFYSYYSLPELKRVDNYISRALILHTYSAFSLTILEYIDISNLSLEKARKLILEREQHYIDSLSPVYNINPIAGSRLGSRHTEETKVLMRKLKSDETKALMSQVYKGKTLFAETKLKLSITRSGENNVMFG